MTPVGQQLAELVLMRRFCAPTNKNLSNGIYSSMSTHRIPPVKQQQCNENRAWMQ